MTTLINTDTDISAPKSQSKKLLVGMIISTVIAVLLAAGLAFLGIIFRSLGGGFGGYFWIIFFGPLFLIIPIIASWVFFIKKNTKWAKIMTMGVWGFFILDAIAIGLLVLFILVISSGP
ncbi:MAG: hypothetical protein AB9891_21315 [Anaerolineaceae bacterium]